MQTSMRIAGDAAARALPRKFAFSVDALARVAVPEGADRVWVYDARTPKLAYMLTRTGAASFYLYAKVDGRPIRYRLGTGAMPIDQARRLCAAKTVEIHNGVNIQDKRRRDRETIRGTITVGKLWEQYRDGWLKAKGRKSTLVSDGSLYKTTIQQWADRRVDQISEGQCRHLHAKLAARGHRTANKAMQLLRRMLNWARLPNPITRGAINWFPEAERERFLTADEMRRFFDAIKAERSPTLRDYLTMAVLTGARRGNLQAMAWAAVDFDGAVWTVHNDQSKSRKAIRVLLSDAAMDILRRRRADIDADKHEGHAVYVFASARRAGRHLTEPRNAWDRVRKAAGLTDVWMHDLRRTFGSWQAIAGASELIVGRSLGHSSREATRIYARLHEGPVRESVNAATAAMLAAAGIVPNDSSKEARDE